MRPVRVFVVAMVTLGIAQSAGAGPIRRLRSAAEFKIAINNPGNPANPSTLPIPELRQPGIVGSQSPFLGLDRNFVPTPPRSPRDPDVSFDEGAPTLLYGRGTTSPTRLYVNTPVLNGLVSSTGSSVNLGQTVIGGFQIRQRDADLTTAYLQNLTVFFPEVNIPGKPKAGGIDTLGIALVDIDGDVKAWGFNTSVLPASGFRTFSFGLYEGAGAGGSTSFFQQPGFDINLVYGFQVSYRGLLDYPDPLAADMPLGAYEEDSAPGALWLGVTDLTIGAVPEPSTLALFAFGAAGMGIRLRLRRRR